MIVRRRRRRRRRRRKNKTYLTAGFAAGKKELSKKLATFGQKTQHSEMNATALRNIHAAKPKISLLKAINLSYQLSVIPPLQVATLEENDFLWEGKEGREMMQF